MLEAMHASRDCAFAFLASRSTSTCTLGEIVAQLMNTFPAALLSRVSPFGAKIFRIALSSVTTVITTSDNSVTRLRDEHASAATSPASVSAAPRFTS
jgi:hypothetical protein